MSALFRAVARVGNTYIWWRGRLRAHFWRPLMGSVGRDVAFLGRIRVAGAPGIRLGNRVWLNRNVVLDGTGGLQVGNDVIVAQDTCIYSAQHRFDRLDVPIMDQGVEGRGTRIGNDVWIGAHVVILPGVAIGNGCVVGAGSVVTKDVPDRAVVAGVPARVIRMRGEEKA